VDNADQSGTSPTLLRDLKNFARSGAWRLFLAKYQPRIAAWCRGLGVTDVDEVTSEVLLRITERIRTFIYDSERRFRSYLRAIVVNVVRDSFTKKQRRPGDFAAGGSAVLDALKQVEGRDGLAEWMEQLEAELKPEQQLAERAAAVVKEQVGARNWDAFRLTAVEKQKGADVAARLEMSVAAVHQAKHRVLMRLRETVAALEAKPGR
jgi:RNA polymerase sigma factor (sigma-70 family)